METGNKFYDNLPEKEQKYARLFEDKSNWYKVDKNEKKDWSNYQDKIDEFNSELQAFIALQSNNEDEQPYNNNTTEEENTPIELLNIQLKYFINLLEEEKYKNYQPDDSKNQEKSRLTIDLSYIHFPAFSIQNYFPNKIDKNIFFSNCVFYAPRDDYIDFFTQTFNGICRFENSHFKDSINFRGATFKKKVFFNNCTFEQNIRFVEATFNNEVYFNNVTVKKTIDLSRVHFEEFFDASGMSFNLLNIKGTYFESPLLLGLSAYENEKKIPLESRHFANKESARLIKDHFEKQNNITEANKYFRIEQEKYLEELISDGYWKNKGDIAVVFLNKIISNHQTSWLRVLLILCIYAFIVFAGYEYFKDFSTLKQGFLASLNKAVELIDPLNMFKRDNNLFENHQALGFAIRIFSLYLFWQFITAFRQNTRRK